jgi:8-oxo-dGTP diphosphatase
MSSSSQLSTQWPRPAVSSAIFHGGEVLLIERGKGALRGRWTLPGGHIEPGETAHAAALREIGEETGVRARLDGIAAVQDVILRNGEGGLQAHYVLSVFHGVWLGGEPVAGSDAAAARFVPLEAIERLPLTDGAAGIIARAYRMSQGAGSMAAPIR